MVFSAIFQIFKKSCLCINLVKTLPTSGNLKYILSLLSLFQSLCIKMNYIHKLRHLDKVNTYPKSFLSLAVSIYIKA